MAGNQSQASSIDALDKEQMKTVINAYQTNNSN